MNSYGFFVSLCRKSYEFILFFASLCRKSYEFLRFWHLYVGVHMIFGFCIGRKPNEFLLCLQKPDGFIHILHLYVRSHTNSFDFDCGLFWNLTIFSCYFQSTEKWMSSTSPEKNLALSRLELHSVELKSRGPAKSTPVVENGSSRHILWINNTI